MATAAFVKQDTTTSGTWIGVYGADGYNVAGGVSSLPSYVSVTLSADTYYAWDTVTTAENALEASKLSIARVAAAWYNITSFQAVANVTDGNTHQIALYFVDFDGESRSQTITLTDSVTGAVLNTQSIANFTGGVWLVWDISGSVTFTFTTKNGPNCVVSGFFFDPIPGSTQPPPATTPPVSTTGQGYTVVMVTTPAAPAHSAVLAWVSTVNATGYNVYRGPVGGTLVKLNASPLTTPLYVDNSVVAGQSYDYATTSIVGGTESAQSIQVPVTIPTP